MVERLLPKRPLERVTNLASIIVIDASLNQVAIPIPVVIDEPRVLRKGPPLISERIRHRRWRQPVILLLVPNEESDCA
jgi:hypothetical protein